MGRALGIVVVGRVVVDWLNAIEVCGRLPYADFGRPPTLLAKLPFDVFLEDTDGVRDDVDDVKEGFRLCMGFCWRGQHQFAVHNVIQLAITV